MAAEVIRRDPERCHPRDAMEFIVYIVLGLSIWILTPSERALETQRAAERNAQAMGHQVAGLDSEDVQHGSASRVRDR
jgi:hypothetical protein